MADPAELIARFRAACETAERASTPPIGSSASAAMKALFKAQCHRDDLERELLSALTPPATPASAEDAAVLDEYDAARDWVNAGHDDSGAFEAARKRFEAARTAVLARMAGKVPPGYKLVPVEPTTGMICAAVGEITSAQARTVWPAMLAAAPESPR